MISILLIDDDRELGILLQECLQEEFELHPAFDGVSGLQEALSHSYAAVILDLMLPCMSGLEGSQASQERERHTGAGFKCLRQRQKSHYSS
jgi:DNA-binding response OmpR family regulator